MYCTKCGSKLSDDAKFCSKCGSPTATDSDNIAYTSTDQIIHQRNNGSMKSNDFVTLTEEETVNAICANCGFDGKMQIIEKSYSTIGRKIMICAVWGILVFVVGYILELILIAILPTLFLYILGFLYGSSALKWLSKLLKSDPISKVKCPKCKQIMKYRKR